MSYSGSVTLSDFASTEQLGACIYLTCGYFVDPYTFNASVSLIDEASASQVVPLSSSLVLTDNVSPIYTLSMQFPSSLALTDNVKVAKTYTFYTIHVFNDVATAKVSASYSPKVRLTDTISTTYISRPLFNASISLLDSASIAPSLKFTYRIALSDSPSVFTPILMSVNSSVRLYDSTSTIVAEKRYVNMLPIILIMLLILIAVLYERGE